ncbi:unknown similar to AcMNPV orf145 [Mythimna separata entomopoxvirus 'L']|uniref:Chitin-binding type-2 domain-containing protein n=1 Tax=Mythimna separata entomopoxvirus 'L' TaxID=1293572 RepID=A0A916KQI8_9POXV|nr:unknown similar to AcMNPV orf145 [Mythimna separata entomopoxvirus 'L']CCU56346.1 unknown similar to AcMNPV orf145 [Mythimna separata entomopoxvirus 'L']
MIISYVIYAIIIICIILLIWIKNYNEYEIIPDPENKICPEGVYGNIPHPTDCNRFYLCAAGNAILLRCPKGEEYDPITKNCILISENGCTSNQNRKKIINYFINLKIIFYFYYHLLLSKYKNYMNLYNRIQNIWNTLITYV